MDIFVIGGGPSCKEFDFSLLDGFTTIGCNDSAFHANTDYMFSLDSTWMNKRETERRKWGNKCVLAITHMNIDYSPNKTYLRDRTAYLCTDKKHIAGKNSGHGAINLAYYLGAGTIHLLGYDMQATGHWHKGYGWGRQTHQNMRDWAMCIDNMKSKFDNLGVKVINWNLDSGIQSYEKRDINDLPCFLRSKRKQ